MYATPEAALYGLDKSGGGKNLPVGTVYIKTNNDEAANPMVVTLRFTDVKQLVILKLLQTLLRHR